MLNRVSNWPARGNRRTDPRASRAACRGWLAATIVAAAGLYLLANQSVSLWDRDEPRYAQTSRQMFRSGDWVVPRLLDQVRTAKPVFIYWCQAASMRLLGDAGDAGVFAARLPSALAMTCTLVLLAALLWRPAGPRRALWTVVIFATSGLVIFSAKTCLTDSVLLLWITIAQACLFAIYRKTGPRRESPVSTASPAATESPRNLVRGSVSGAARSQPILPLERSSAGVGTQRTLSQRTHSQPWPLALTMWAAIGLAVLTKGPVVFGVLLPTLLALACFDVGPRRKDARAWWRAVRWWLGPGALLRAFVGLCVVAAIVGPWVYLVSRRHPGFISQAWSHEVKDRIVEAQEQHGGPPGYYALTLWGTFFPWSLLLVPALVIGWRHRRVPHVRFALATVVGPWLVFECVRTKLPHYLLPVYSSLAFLAADALVRCARGQHDDLTRPLVLLPAALWSAAALALCLLPWLALQKFAPLPRSAGYAMTALTLLGGTWAVAVFHRFRTRRVTGAAAAMAGGMVAVIATLFAGFLPRAPFLRVPNQVADALIEQGATHPGDAIMIDYKENSLAFYQGGAIRPERLNSYLEKTPPGQWPRWIVLTDEVWQKTPPDRRALLEILKTVHGLNYADKGRVVDVRVVRRK